MALYGDYAVAVTVWGPGLYILRVPTATPTPSATAGEGLTPVIATIPVGDDPQAVRVDPSTNRIYVANQGGDTVSVIDGANNVVIATVPVGDRPFAIGVNSTTGRVYVTNQDDDTVSVIDGTSNAVIATIPVGDRPWYVGVNPTTDRVYIGNRSDGTVSVIDGGPATPSSPPSP